MKEFDPKHDNDPNIHLNSAKQRKFLFKEKNIPVIKGVLFPKFYTKKAYIEEIDQPVFNTDFPTFFRKNDSWHFIIDIDWYWCYFDHKNKKVFWSKSPLKFEIDFYLKAMKNKGEKHGYPYPWHKKPYSLINYIDNDIKIYGINFHTTHQDQMNQTDGFYISQWCHEFSDRYEYDMGEVKKFFKIIKTQLEKQFRENIDDINKWIFYWSEMNVFTDIDNTAKPEMFEFGLKFDIDKGKQIK